MNVPVKWMNLYIDKDFESQCVSYTYIDIRRQWLPCPHSLLQMSFYMVTANHHGVALSNKFSILDYQQEDRYKITIT